MTGHKELLSGTPPQNLSVLGLLPGSHRVQCWDRYFTPYNDVQPIYNIIRKSGHLFHHFADDLQLYLTFDLSV